MTDMKKSRFSEEQIIGFLKCVFQPIVDGISA